MGLIGIAASALGAGLGLSSAIKNSEKQRELAEQEAENRRMYVERARARAAADSGEDAVSEGIRRRTADEIRARNKAAAGTAAVMGSTTEAQLAEVERNNQLMDKANQTTEQYVAKKRQQNAARLDSAETAAYKDEQSSIAQQQQELAKANSQAMSALSGGVSDAIDGISAAAKQRRLSVWD